jgi:K+-transporting ATPase c subunit
MTSADHRLALFERDQLIGGKTSGGSSLGNSATRRLDGIRRRHATHRHASAFEPAAETTIDLARRSALRAAGYDAAISASTAARTIRTRASGGPRL